MKPTFLLAPLLLFAAACGIPLDESAQVINDPPQELFDELAAATTSTALASTDPQIILRLYWHDEADELVIVRRGLARQPTPDEALAALTQGPTEEELRADRTTFIQVNFESLLDPKFTEVEAGIATISVADEANLRNSVNPIIAAEIVCTMLQFRNVDGVEITDSAGKINLTDIGANPIEGAARLIHFDECLEPIVPTQVNETPPSTDG